MLKNSYADLGKLWKCYTQATTCVAEQIYDHKIVKYSNAVKIEGLGIGLHYKKILLFHKVKNQKSKGT